ncbi:MAG: Na/Pi cotransporter family protein [Bacillota bacterium]
MFWEIALTTLGGLGLFLFGIQIMASGMQKAAGDRFRRILEVLTNKPILGVLTGILVTILVQSSSTATVMVVGFANAGLMNLSQAISVIIGANVGTTVTAQLVSFEIWVIALPAIGFGSLLNFFGRRRIQRYLGQTILGVGLLFLGMITMSDGMSPLQDLQAFYDMLLHFSAYPILGIIAGAIFTALIQSSSAATGVIIAMTTQNLIPFDSAVPLVLGTNIGTSFTAILASIGANVAARRAAAAHVVFNVVGVTLVLIFIVPFSDLMVHTAGEIPRQVANTHTAFNVFNTIVFLVFLKYFNRLICRIIPGDGEKMDYGPKYLDSRILKTPAVAIGGAKQELLRMAGIAREMLDESLQVFQKGDLKKMKHIDQMENLVDGLEEEINVYLSELSQHSMTQQQTKLVSNLMSAANDLERIGDHAENIMQLGEMKVEDKLPFSDTAVEEVSIFGSKISSMLEKAIRAFETNDKEQANEVVEEDKEIDIQEKYMRKAHIDRINTKKCYPSAGVIFLDLLSNLERVGDHAKNIAELVLEEG